MTRPSAAALRTVLDRLGRPAADARVLRGVAAAGVLSDDVAVEVGCGSGVAAALLRRTTGARVVGVDVDRRAVAGARRNGVPAVVGDALELPLRDRSVDVVVCEDALSAVVSPARAVAEMVRVLRPGGHLVVTDVVAELDLPRSHPRLHRALRRLGTPLSTEGYRDLTARARLEPVLQEASGDDVTALAGAVRQRLRLLTPVPGIAQVRAVAAEAADAAAAGSLGYLLLVGRRPTSG